MSFDIKIKDRDLQKKIKRAQKETPKKIRGVVNKTARASITKLKTELPKRTGNLRRSYNIFSEGTFGKKIKSSMTTIADIVESGRRARTIRPKRGKFLFFPVDDSVMVPSKARMKKLGKKRFQKEIKAGNIAVAKKVRQPKLKGQKNIEREVIPFTDKFFEKEMDNAFKDAI